MNEVNMFKYYVTILFLLSACGKPNNDRSGFEGQWISDSGQEIMTIHSAKYITVDRCESQIVVENLASPYSLALLRVIKSNGLPDCLQRDIHQCHFYFKDSGLIMDCQEGPKSLKSYSRL